MAHTYQIQQMKKTNMSEPELTDVITDIQVTIVVDHLGARRLRTVEVSIAPPTDSSSFTNLAELTENQVTAWVETSLGQEQRDAIIAELEAECDECINGRSNIVDTPPWITPSGG